MKQFNEEQESTSTYVLKAASIKEANKINKKQNKNKKHIFIEKYAELFNGSLVKITHEFESGMLIGDVLSEYSEKIIGSLYFPVSYVKSFEEISVK